MESHASMPSPNGETVSVTYRYETGRCDAKVSPGQRISAGDTIAVRKVSPPLRIVDLAGGLKRQGKSATKALSHSTGAVVSEGERLAEASGPFGLGWREVLAPVTGTIKGFVEEDGVVFIRPGERQEAVKARFDATVTAVQDGSIDVELVGQVVRAAGGAGPVMSSVLAVLEATDSISNGLRSVIAARDVTPPRAIVLPGPIDTKTVQLVREAFWDPGPVAVIAPSAPYLEFERMMETYPATTLVIVGGFGRRSFLNGGSDPIWETLLKSKGRPVVVIPQAADGRALLVIPGEPAGTTAPSELGTRIGHGVVVRFSRGLEVVEGVVSEFIDMPYRLPSGYVTRCARLTLEDGSRELVGLDNLEIVAACPPALEKA